MSLISRLLDSPYVPSARSVLMTSLGLIFLISLMMVVSASVPFATRREEFIPLKFFFSQFGYMLIALTAAMVVYSVPLKKFYEPKVQAYLWGAVLLLLVATAVFGQKIYGAKRWLSLLGFSFQAAEFAKMLIVLILAYYMGAESARVRYHSLWRSVLFIGVVYFPILLLLLLQPDYGSIVVIIATILIMFFVGGAKIWQYLTIVGLGIALGVVGILIEPYRLTRAISFWDPFDDVMNTDYQLSRSLVAFTRGDLTGVGYGNSIQKLHHLPEAHTDFLLAITGEEFGFFGVATVLMLEFLVLASIMRIGYKSLVRRQLRLSYTAFGFAVIFFGQILINAGMNLGLLPTKGLTMPFFSYGGSSMLFSVIMVAIILKIDQQSPKINKDDNREY